jgi:dihydrofolate reductase
VKKKQDKNMRKLFWQMNMTLDGFMEGPNRELNHTAQIVGEDFDRYATDMLKSIDAILLGRVTYQLFAGYWPSATGPDADRLNELPKIVFSRTLERVEWKNSRLVKEDVAKEITRLKQQPGKDIALFGSAASPRLSYDQRQNCSKTLECNDVEYRRRRALLRANSKGGEIRRLSWLSSR